MDNDLPTQLTVAAAAAKAQVLALKAQMDFSCATKKKGQRITVQDYCAQHRSSSPAVTEHLIAVSLRRLHRESQKEEDDNERRAQEQGPAAAPDTSLLNEQRAEAWANAQEAGHKRFLVNNTHFLGLELCP